MFRKMRRAGQQLDVEEVRQVLENAPRGVLSVLGDDDYPYGIPMNFVYDPTRGKLGSLYFHSALVGHKIDAMAACDKVSFCTMDEGYQNEGEWWWYFNSVICFGRICTIEEPTRKHEALTLLAKKYFPPNINIAADIAKNGYRIHALEFRIEHMTGKLVQEK